MTTAVLGTPPLSPRGWRRHGLGRTLPSTALFAATAGLLTAGAVPGVDAELVLAGLGLASLAPLAARERRTARRLAASTATIARLEAERTALATQVRSRADELDLATRMLAARAQTMTSVIDAVTEQ